MSDGQSADASQFRHDLQGRELLAACPPPGAGRLDMIAVRSERLATSDRYLPAIPADSEPPRFD